MFYLEYDFRLDVAYFNSSSISEMKYKIRPKESQFPTILIRIVWKVYALTLIFNIISKTF